MTILDDDTVDAVQVEDHEVVEGRGIEARVASGVAELECVAKVVTLGAEGVLPSRQIESFLRVFKQFAHTLPSRQVVG